MDASFPRDSTGSRTGGKATCEHLKIPKLCGIQYSGAHPDTLSKDLFEAVGDTLPPACINSPGAGHEFSLTGGRPRGFALPAGEWQQGAQDLANQ